MSPQMMNGHYKSYMKSMDNSMGGAYSAGKMRRGSGDENELHPELAD